MGIYSMKESAESSDLRDMLRGLPLVVGESRSRRELPGEEEGT